MADPTMPSNGPQPRVSLAVNRTGLRPLLAVAALADRALDPWPARGRWATVKLGGVVVRRPRAMDPGGPTRARSAVYELVLRPWVPFHLSRPAVGPLVRIAPTLVCDVDPASFRSPVVFVTFHMGQVTAVAPFLARLRGPSSFAVMHPERVARTRVASDGRVQLRPAMDEGQRAAAYVHAVRTLRDGGFALALIDAQIGRRVAAPVLGREMLLANGPFALSRATGAPIVPLLVRWHGGRMHLVSGEPIAVAEASSMADSVGAWLEWYLREHPDDLSAYVARALGVPLRPGPLSLLRRAARRLVRARSDAQDGRRSRRRR